MIHIQCIITFNMRHLIKQIIILLINYGFCFLYIIITLINILLIHVMYISNIIVQFDDLSYFPLKNISFHCHFSKSQINLSLCTSFCLIIPPFPPGGATRRQSYDMCKSNTLAYCDFGFSGLNLNCTYFMSHPTMTTYCLIAMNIPTYIHANYL